MTSTTMMDVVVKNSPIGDAEVLIDLGVSAGFLRVDVCREGDRFRRVRIRWRNPINGQLEWIARGLLDTVTGELLSHELDGHDKHVRRRSRERS